MLMRNRYRRTTCLARLRVTGKEVASNQGSRSRAAQARLRRPWATVPERRFYACAPGLCPDRPPSDRPGDWPCQDGLTQVLGHARGPLITTGRVKPASTTAPTHLVPVADPSDPIPTQGRDLLKPGRAKARIGHNHRPATDRQQCLQLVAETPGACAVCPSSPTYAPLHTRWQSDRSPPH